MDVDVSCVLILVSIFKKGERSNSQEGRQREWLTERRWWGKSIVLKGQCPVGEAEAPPTDRGLLVSPNLWQKQELGAGCHLLLEEGGG